MPDLMSMDAETHSSVDLTSRGADAYTRDPGTRALMMAYHLVGSSSPGRLWLEGDPVPPEWTWHVNNGGKLSGWNVMFFDRLVYNRILVPRWGFPAVSDDAWVDSMHRASVGNRPRSLDACGKAVGLPFDANLKDKNNVRRITSAKTSVIPGTVSDILNGRIELFPELQGRFRQNAATKLVNDLTWLAERCRQDIVMEEALLSRLPEWPTVEPWLNMPYIDRKINDRGVLLDVELVQGLITAAGKEARRMDESVHKLTHGAVRKMTNVEELKHWLVSRGVTLPSNIKEEEEKPEDNPFTIGLELDDDDVKEDKAAKKRGSPYKLRKHDISNLLADPSIPEDCRLALEMRSEGSKVSARKFNTMLSMSASDGRLHNTMTLGGAQQTMRFASRGANLYNTVRDVFANPDEIGDLYGLDTKTQMDQIHPIQENELYHAIMAGRRGDPDEIRERYQRVRKDAQGREQTMGVLTWISRMTRRTIAAPEGSLLINGDYSQIEARVTDWLSQQIDMLEAYYSGQDVYKILAANIYKIKMESLSKEQRQAGKVAKLACIAEGSLVLTDKGLIPIQEVSLDCKVWDGVEWVAHDGPVFMGWKDTIQHDGLEATSDHIVFTEGATREMAFGDAAASKISLTKTGNGRQAIRTGRNNTTRLNIRDALSLVCRHTVHKMRIRTMDFLLQFNQWTKQRVSSLHTGTAQVAPAIGQNSDGGETAMRKSQGSRLSQLWRSRHSVLFSISNSSRVVDTGKSWTSARRNGYRSNKQQQELRTGQFALGNATTKFAKYTAMFASYVFGQASSDRTRFAHNSVYGAEHKICGSNFAPISEQQKINRESYGTNTQSTPVIQAGRPVWDILNAGPRHRFTVSDRLVHNCGFGGGPAALMTMAYNYGLILSIEEATEIVRAYRQANQALVRYWYATDDAAANAVKYPGREFPVEPLGLVTYYTEGDCLLCRLPSGRTLRYWQPRLVQEYWTNEDGSRGKAKDRLSLYGIQIKGPNAAHRSLYHTILVENQVQAIATADMLSQGLVNMDRENIPVVLHVYDSIAAEERRDLIKSTITRFNQAMIEQSAWTLGLPIKADIEVSSRFG